MTLTVDICVHSQCLKRHLGHNASVVIIVHRNIQVITKCIAMAEVDVIMPEKVSEIVQILH